MIKLHQACSKPHRISAPHPPPVPDRHHGKAGGSVVLPSFTVPHSRMIASFHCRKPLHPSSSAIIPVRRVRQGKQQQAEGTAVQGHPMIGALFLCVCVCAWHLGMRDCQSLAVYTSSISSPSSVPPRSHLLLKRIVPLALPSGRRTR